MTDTRSTRTPLTEFDPKGQATILSYNVPQPTSYTGRNIIELPLEALGSPREIFKVDSAFKVPDRTPVDAQLDAAGIAQKLRTGDVRLFPNCQEALVPLPALLATQLDGAEAVGSCLRLFHTVSTASVSSGLLSDLGFGCPSPCFERL